MAGYDAIVVGGGHNGLICDRAQRGGLSHSAGFTPSPPLNTMADGLPATFPTEA